MERSVKHVTLLGAILGLAWGTGLRGWMAVFAGQASTFTWSGTFIAFLLPATVVGTILAWAEGVRRSGHPGARRWAALAPLLFVVTPALVQDDFVAQLRTGLGTGAIGMALIGIVGGYALAGRGPRWAILLARLLMVALIAATIAGTFLGAAEPRRQGATTPWGAYLALTFLVFSGLLAWACAIPHLPAQHAATRER